MSENKLVKEKKPLNKDINSLCTEFISYISKKQYKKATIFLDHNPDLLPRLGYNTLFAYIRILNEIPKTKHSENYKNLYNKIHNFLDSRLSSHSERLKNQEDLESKFWVINP